MAGQIIPKDPAQEAYQQALFRRLASLPADVRNFISDQYQNAQITVLPLPYWSTARYQATIAANVASIAAGTVCKAFAYAQGGAMQIAGFPTGFRVANLSDTNLLTQSQTRDNADVWIWGLAAAPTPDSEPLLMREVWRKASVSISLNGTQTIPLGTLEMFPSAGGLYGSGVTNLLQPPFDTAGQKPVAAGDGSSGVGAGFGFLSNGNPMAGNFFRLPQPFKWSAIGSAGSDSSLVIESKVETAISLQVSANRAAAAGIDQFTQPEAGDVGTYVDVRWHLICVAVSRRSVNA